jgi:anti-anti-sigma factor
MSGWAEDGSFLPGPHADAVACFDQATTIHAFYASPDLVPTALNPAARAIMGNPEVGRSLRGTAIGMLNRDLFRRIGEVAATGREWRRGATPFHALDADGRPYATYLDVLCKPVPGGDGETRGVTMEAREVTQPDTGTEVVTATGPPAPDGAATGPREAAALQNALLPAALPVLPQAALAATYLSCATSGEGGGDWFDATVRPDGSLALVVGDVVGRGTNASAVMGQLRAVTRHCLLGDAPPEAAMAELDRFAAHLPGAHAATACLVMLDPTTGVLRYCTAGHPPPLLVDGDGGYRYLAPTCGGPFGTGAAHAAERDQLADGELLLLYTNGAVNRPERHPVQAAAELADAAVGAAAGSGSATAAAQRVCARVVELVSDPPAHAGGRADDTALLAACRHPAIGPLRVTLPATPLAVPTGRTALRAWLETLATSDADSSALLHAVGEIVTNVVEHAYADGPGGRPALVIRAYLTPIGQVEVAVVDRGRWRPHRYDPHRGFGLSLAEELVDDLIIDRAPTGTRVLLRRAVGRPTRTARHAHAVDGAPTRDDERYLAALTSTDDPAAVLVVSGPVDIVTAPGLREQLRSITGNGTLSRAVDLTGVTLLTSAGVQVLHEARQRSRAHHEHLTLLANPGSAAHHVMALTGLTARPSR